MLPFEICKKRKIPIIITFIQCSAGVSSRCCKSRKRKKIIEGGKKQPREYSQIIGQNKEEVSTKHQVRIHPTNTGILFRSTFKDFFF